MEKIDITCTPGEGNDVTILTLRGPLTLATLFDLQTAVRQPGLGNTILDLTEVPYIDSAGLGTILSHWAHTQRIGKKFAVTGACERVQVLFQLTKVNSLLPCFATANEACQNFSSATA